jgi:hypothetical protein
MPVSAPVTSSNNQTNQTVVKQEEPEELSTFTMFSIYLLVALLFISAVYNCKLYWALRKSIKATEMTERKSFSSSETASSAPLKGGRKSPATSYSKVQVDSDDSDDDGEEAIEFNDLDMNPKEFNPFNRLKAAVATSNVV